MGSLGVKLLGTTPKFRKIKTTLSSCVYILCYTSHKEMSRHVRSGEGTNCTMEGVVLLTKSIAFSDVSVAISIEASKGLFTCRWGSQIGEVTRFGGVTRLSIQSLILIWSRLHDRWVDPPHVTLPMWGPPPRCKHAPKLPFKIRWWNDNRDVIKATGLTH